MNNLWDNYFLFKNQEFSQRYLPLGKIKTVLSELPDDFRLKTEGFSVLKKPIWSVSFGNGNTKILMWSQMHGNETTTTKAVFDVFKTFEIAGQQSQLQKILFNCTLKIIPVLNPDGGAEYTRENANGVDLNRDAQAMSQPESQVLAEVFNDFGPDFCFNLHDQRSIYSAGNCSRSAVVSFLASSFNAEKSINKTREISMKLIAEVNDGLQKYIPQQIGRYDDAYNANCVGDKFQSMKVPTLLFEAGHFQGDYQREETRKLVYIALMKSLESISNKTYAQIDTEKYKEIPENKKMFFDIVLRDVRVNGRVSDLAIQYEEQLVGKEIKFNPIIERIGDLAGFYAHREIDAHKQILTVNGGERIEMGLKVTFLKIGNENILLKLKQS